MKTKAMIFMTAVVVSMLAGCCERRCGIQCQKQPEPINLQEHLQKMKQEAGGKGPK